jgi:hypothetical protein
MAGTADHPSLEQTEPSPTAMKAAITQLLPRLGSSYSKGAEQHSVTEETGPLHSEESRNCWGVESSLLAVDFPSLSLARDEFDHDFTVASRSKGEVQVHASSLLARQLLVTDPSEFHRVPVVMLENLFAAFDTLVDARILVYSKILRSHARSLARCNDANNSNDASTGLMAVEYKLKTLLEIGTSLSADSFATKFSVSSIATVDGTKAEVASDGSSIIIVPITIEAHIADLHVHSPVEGLAATIPLTFQAEGSITGKFASFIFRALLKCDEVQNSYLFSNYHSTNDSPLYSHLNPGTFTEKSNLAHVTVDVDTDALLSSMIAQATLVVASVVDVTNEAWTRTAVIEAPEADDDRVTIESDQFLDTEHCERGEPNKISPELGPAPAANNGIGHLNLIEDSCNDLVSAERNAKRPLENEAEPDEEDSIGSMTDVSHLVDYAIGELDDSFIARSPSKRLCLPTL